MIKMSEWFQSLVLSCACKKEPKKHARRHLSVSSHEFKKQARNKTRISRFFCFLNSCSGQLQAGRRVAIPVIFAMALSSCGYHLVGHGDGTGAIPEDVVTVSVQAVGASAKPFLFDLKHQLEGSDRYKVIDAESVTDEASHAVIRIEKVSESFVPSAYDQSGIATQYRMRIQGHVRLYRAGKMIWESGAISKSGDVFVTGGPAGTEASGERIREDLRREWILTAWSRIGSGF